MDQRPTVDPWPNRYHPTPTASFQIPQIRSAIFHNPLTESQPSPPDGESAPFVSVTMTNSDVNTETLKKVKQTTIGESPLPG